MSQDQQVAIVTGAASGIGAATSRRLSASGVAVVLADQDDAGLQDVRLSLANPDAAICVAGDVSNPATAQRMVQAAVEGFGRIDILVNNAGIADLGAAETLAHDRWRRVLDVNLSGAFYVAQAVGVQMIAQGHGGAIVNTASMAGVAGMPDHIAYVASKHGVVGITKALAVEWAEYGIRVNALCPGLTDTEIVRHATAQSPEIMGARARRTLFGRLATADEQAAMVCFLVSSDASYVSGLIANVDGGGLALYSGYATGS